MTNDLCPCGSKEPLKNCCGPLIQGEQKAASAERLMRSRFSAFYTANIPYLMRTLHPSKHDEHLHDDLTKSVKSTQWLSLRIIGTPSKDTQYAYVEFVAFYHDKHQPNTTHQLHEKSRFIHEEGKFYYLDGEFLPPIKLGRNDLCWCGSGAKVKKCSH